jgi:hypothetical protein
MRKYIIKNIFYFLIVASFLMCSSSCKSKKTSATEPFISFEVKLSQTKIPINSPLEMTYTWKIVDNQKKLGEDYKVFVHFLDKKGNMFLNDDHFSPVRTSDWNAGKSIEYERTLFFSNISTLGEGKVKIGLYKNNENMERIPLIGEDEGGDLSYTVADIEVVGEELDKEPIFKDGWYEPEYTTQGDRVVEWSWTKKEAKVAFLNPSRDATLYFYGHAPVKELEGGQKIALELNGQEIDSFTIESSDDFIRRIKINKSIWGNNKWADLAIKVDKSFVPSPDGIHGDLRELGIKVYNLYLFY